LGQAAMMAQAAQQGGSFEGFLEQLEEMEQSPMKARGAIQGAFTDPLTRKLAYAAGTTGGQLKEAEVLARDNLAAARGMRTDEFERAFPREGVTPGLQKIATAEGEVALEVQKNFIEALKDFTEVLKERKLSQATIGEGTAGASAGLNTLNPINALTSLMRDAGSYGFLY
jgi:hypothetical protein